MVCIILSFNKIQPFIQRERERENQPKKKKKEEKNKKKNQREREIFDVTDVLEGQKNKLFWLHQNHQNSLQIFDRR